MKIFLAINIPGYSTIQFKVIQNEKRKKTVLIPKKYMKFYSVLLDNFIKHKLLITTE